MHIPYTPYQILAYFFIYCFLGWCVEVIYCTLVSGQLVNRGFLNGPVCPIYGFGMVGILILLYPVFDNLPLLFLGATAITSGVELFGGWALYHLFHARWWDYTDRPFNLGGYICAQFCVTWGVSTLGVIKIVHPIVELVANVLVLPAFRLPLVLFFMALMAVDFTASVLTAIGLNRRLKELDALNARLRQHSDTLSNILGNTAITADQIKDEKQLQLMLARMELDDRLAQLRDELEDGIARRRSQIEGLHKGSWFGSRRMLAAFPGLRHRDYQDALNRVREATQAAKAARKNKMQ